MWGADLDVSYVWHGARVPRGLEVLTVHGFLICPATGRALLQERDGCFNLPGGSPDPDDADFSATLAREASEESQVVAAELTYLGYQEVCRADRAPSAQVRLAGLIAEFGPSRCDPDSGRLLRRLMCPLAQVPAVLGGGPVMKIQVGVAARIADQLWGVPASAPEPAGYVD
jgi:8-oxo-dGTP diphosphatase